MPEELKRKRQAVSGSSRPRQDPLRFDATLEARRRWEERGWPTSDAMEAAVSVMHAGRMIRAGLDQIVEPFGLSYSQYEVLGILSFSHERQMSMNRLSRHLLLHPASITTIVDRLCGRGWVTRVTNPADRRVVHVELTAEGQETVIEATKAIGVANFGMGNLDRRQLSSLAEMIRDLRRFYGKITDDCSRSAPTD